MPRGRTTLRSPPTKTASCASPASYRDGHGSGKSATAELAAARAAPASNSPPTFPASETGQRSVPENTAAGQRIGYPIKAFDDPADRLTYTLDSAGEALFDIDGNTGQLRTEASLDHETRSSYIVTVTATDPRAHPGHDPRHHHRRGRQ